MAPAAEAPPEVRFQISEQALTLSGSVGQVAECSVFAKGSAHPLFGAFEAPAFVPAAHFLKGATYRVEIRFKNGTGTSLELTLDGDAASTPSVSLSPAARRIPENTLKLYLDFSEPMEQGVFLERIALVRADGREVRGAFRETELWSPDGRRLTVMLHPGRQKTGVNLNVEEGPVLTAGKRYGLIVSEHWRSTQGVPLGKAANFALEAVPADHEQPDPTRWKVELPSSGTREALVLTTDELFEPQILNRSIRVQGIPGESSARVEGEACVQWRFTPAHPWKAGEVLLCLDPWLEDLAGNSIQKPFEVDLSNPAPQPRPNQMKARIP